MNQDSQPPIGLPDDARDEAPYRHSERLIQPFTFEVTAKVSELIAEFGDLEPGVESDRVVAIAGRMMLRRGQGKLTFATLDDGTDRIQLFGRAGATPDYEAFAGLNLGDWVGVNGVVMTTKRGELSVRVDDWVRLAQARRGFPDKWHGITDPDMRFRQRYVDLWVTEGTRDRFLARSKAVSLTRRFMEERGYVEVETPLLHSIVGGATARPFLTQYRALDQQMNLRIAPELYLKRLVVGGFDKVFELGRTFRNEGISNRHNPEFTMLECYEAYGDYQVHMELSEALVAHLCRALRGTTEIEYQGRPIDLTPPWRRATMAELVTDQLGEQRDVHTPIEVLRADCERLGIDFEDWHGPGKLLLEIYEKTVESQLWEPTFVTDYPAEVSPLARRHRDDPALTERFEAIVGGRELCNGFSELTDPEDQLGRFHAQEVSRARGDDEAMGLDRDYVRALEFGLPPTVGLGIGFDRLVMLLTDAANIREVVLFPTLRPEVEIDLVVEYTDGAGPTSTDSGLDGSGLKG